MSGGALALLRHVALIYSTRWTPVSFLKGVVEVVDDGHVVAMLKKTEHCVRACIHQ